MELKPGYRKTDIGVLPEDWEVSALQAVCVPNGLVRGPFGGSLKKDIFVNSGYKVYEQKNAIYRSEEAGFYFVDAKKYRELKRFYVVEGDFIVSCSGTIGRIFQIPCGANPGIINQALLKIRTNHDIVADDYFFQVFDSPNFQQKIVESTQGGAMQNLVGMDVFKNTLIALPPLPEQRAIAEALGDADGLLDELERLLAKKRDLKVAAMQQLLTGKTRLPGFSGEWEEKQIGAFAECSAGGTPSTISKEFWNGSIRWMSSGELNQRRVVEVEGRITRLGLEKSAAKILPPKCVLIGLAGQGKTRGTVAINLVSLSTNQSIGAILPNHSFVSEYLYHHLDSRYDELRELSSGGGGRGGLNLTIIKSLLVPMPELPEQIAIAEILSDMDADVAALEAQRDKTRDLKTAMQQQLLTGQTRLLAPAF